MTPPPDTDSTTGADQVTGSPVYPLGSTINDAGHVEVGGCDLVELAREFGTPAYIYDEDDLRARARSFRTAFAERTDDFDVLFASKAAPISAIFELFASEGLAADVASGGELHMALAAGFDPSRIFMHGNNKTAAELSYAFESGVGQIVVDSLDEIARADDLLDREQDVLVRITPGIKPSTHSYIQTGQIDSKFGLGIADGLAAAAIEAVDSSRHLNLVGLHAHIGSQIYELEPFAKAIEVLAELLGDRDPGMINIGGGLGIAYRRSDEPPSIEDYVEVKYRALEQVFSGRVPRILIEPGRSLVGNAGITVYDVGTVKEIPGVRTYVAVNGGMSDNLRPMLYGSEYEALIANRANDPADTNVTIAGMHCESGDVLVRDARLASPRVGDLLVTPATGAYGYAMANNYNGVPRPPVVFCSGGDARVVVRRESYDDLLSRDV